MRLSKRLLATVTVGVVIGVSACGSDAGPAADVAAPVTSSPTAASPAPTSDRAVAETGSALDAIAAYADDWSIAFTDEQLECLSDNLGEEFQSAGESLGEVDNALFLLACEVDVSGATGGDGRSPLEAIVAALLVDEDAEITDEVVTCVTDALVAGFGVDGFVDLLTSAGEPTSDDDATAQAAFDSCGLDGDAIVNG